MTRFNRKTALGVVLGVGLLAAAWFVAVTIYEGPRVIYYAELAEVTGVEVGMKVLYLGFPVGEVREVRIRPRQGHNSGTGFSIALAVESNIRIPVGSFMQVRSGGLMEAATIYIYEGESERYLASGDIIEARQHYDSMAHLEEITTNLLTIIDRSVEPLLANMADTMLTVRDIIDTDLRSLADNASRTSGQIADRTPELLSNISETQSILRANLVRLESVLSNIEPEDTKLLLTNLNRSSDELQRLLSDLTLTHRRVDTLLSTWTSVVADNKLEIDQSIFDLSNTLSALSHRAATAPFDLEGVLPTE